MKKTNIFIVIAAYNEGSVIEDVIDEVRKCDYSNIVIIDDGSKDLTFEKSKNKGVTALRHKINRGKGAAVKTGFAAANLLGADIIVTMDGDGQHDANDIANLIKPILEEGVDVVLGSRLLDTTGMPFIKILANKIGNAVTFLFYGITVSDSQSGFRAYSRYAVTKIDTKGDKYEYDSKVLREVKNNRLKFVEVPIAVRYTEYSMGKAQKQGFVNGLKTLGRMVWDMIV
ncbi:glycosyltransferase family 2 protein [Desulforhopalus sp. 52FAK]